MNLQSYSPTHFYGRKKCQLSYSSSAILLACLYVTSNSYKIYNQLSMSVQENRISTANKEKNTFPRRSSPEGREITKGGFSLPEGNTSDNAPFVAFSIMYSFLIPKHIFSPHQDIDFTTSGTPYSFMSTNPRPPKQNTQKTPALKNWSVPVEMHNNISSTVIVPFTNNNFSNPHPNHKNT